MNKDNYRCYKCNANLLRLNFGLLAYQWDTYGKYYCYDDMPAEEKMKIAQRREKREQRTLNALWWGTDRTAGDSWVADHLTQAFLNEVYGESNKAIAFNWSESIVDGSYIPCSGGVWMEGVEFDVCAFHWDPAKNKAKSENALWYDTHRNKH